MPTFRLRQVALCVCMCLYVCVCVYIYEAIISLICNQRHPMQLNPPNGIHQRHETSVHLDYVIIYADRKTITTFISLPNSFKLYGIRIMISTNLILNLSVIYERYSEYCKPYCSALCS
jgi:hypothetical protein